MEFKTFSSIFQLDCAQWDALWPTNYPFCRWDFLAALEQSGCTNAQSGWAIQHAAVVEDRKLLAVMPMYAKTHSYGEYVFDWAWADAYQRHGLSYYPKLLAAVPFTPCTGPRWASANQQAEAFLLENVLKIPTETSYSSLHILFPEAAPANLNGNLSRRLGCQFHWFNDNYDTFDDFLAGFNSRKRKSLKKERKSISQQGFTVSAHEGTELTPEDWSFFTKLYMRTYLKRSGHTGYLNEGLFKQLGERLAENILMVKAHSNGEWVAAALYFHDNQTLYGRYWGATNEFDNLHFECCYYQGIEYAIQKKLHRFDPGAQGEHKIQRGFTPVFTQSFHYIKQPEFAHAISDFVQSEALHQQSYCESARTLLPFKEGEKQIASDVLLTSIQEY